MLKDVFLDTDLSQIESHCWDLLYKGVMSYKNPFHYGIFTSTYDAFPESRTVILRSVDTAQKIIRFNTDIRSPKFQQIQENPNVCWLFYDPDLRIQLRCKALATVHIQDEIAAEGWHQIRLNAKLTYASEIAPGSLLDAPGLVDLNRTDVAAVELDEARKNFSIIQTQVLSMDWSFLHYKGNRRAFFDYKKQTQSWMQT